MKIQEDKGVQFDFRQFYAIRFVCLVEIAPNSDTYKQIALTEEEHRKISELVWKLHNPDPKPSEPLGVHLIEKEITLPDIKDTYIRK